MQLAEGLDLLADLRKRRDTLRNRIRKSLFAQDGDSILEDPKKLICHCRAFSEEICRLEAAIMHTNSSNYMESEQGRISLAEAIIRREDMRETVRFLRAFGEKAASRIDDYSVQLKIPTIPCLSAAKLQSDADDITHDLRELELGIERLGWTLTLDGYLANNEIMRSI